MFKKILFAAFIIILKLNAQVSVSADSILFPQILTGTKDSISFYIANHDNKTTVVQISNLKSIYNLSDTLLNIPSNDSSIVWIKYSPAQNVIDEDLIMIKSDDSLAGAIIKIKGSGKYGDAYDAATFNLYDAQLKSALSSMISNHTSLGYNLARDKMFMEIDNQKVNGQGAAQNTLECVYTGRLAVGYTSRTQAQNLPYNFNTEHTWPQSTFSEMEPMKSDLYHLYPTDNPANSARSNYPFGNVVSNITWQVGGSKLGNNSSGQIVFEPRDVHKGNLSRSMFYFITRYPVNYGNFFTQAQENVFRVWNKLDPVDVVESNRNNAIAQLQLNRNPYIDHPEFIDRIYSFVNNNSHPVFAELKVLPLKLDFDSVLINNSATKDFYVANSGSSQLNIDSISVSDSRFSVSTNNFTISSYSYSKLSVQFNPDSIKDYQTDLIVFSNAGTSQITLKGIGKDNAVNVEEAETIPLAFSLEQNYPNPFNPETSIRYSIAKTSFIKLKIYDLLGREITTLVNETQNPGSYQVNFKAQDVSSGMYFYRLETDNFISTKKMLLLR